MTLTALDHLRNLMPVYERQVFFNEEEKVAWIFQAGMEAQKNLSDQETAEALADWIDRRRDERREGI